MAMPKFIHFDPPGSGLGGEKREDEGGAAERAARGDGIPEILGFLVPLQGEKEREKGDEERGQRVCTECHECMKM